MKRDCAVGRTAILYCRGFLSRKNLVVSRRARAGSIETKSGTSNLRGERLSIGQFFLVPE